MPEQTHESSQSKGLVFIRQEDVLKKTALSRSTLYELVNSGKFPKPLKVGERINAWPEREVDAWMRARMADRDTAGEAGAM